MWYCDWLLEVVVFKFQLSSRGDELIIGGGGKKKRKKHECCLSTLICGERRGKQVRSFDLFEFFHTLPKILGTNVEEWTYQSIEYLRYHEASILSS